MKRRGHWIWLGLLGLIVGAMAVIWIVQPRLAYVPAQSKVLNPPESGRARGIDAHVLKLGRKAFYSETFGNEVFTTDILGTFNGALSLPSITKALIALRGRGTTNLQVALAKTVTLGDKTFPKGTLLNTGLDVPKGAWMPLGMPVRFANGHLMVGITCAACHATVDPVTYKVVEGATNSDFNAGMLLALSTNSAVYFAHTNIDDLSKYVRAGSQTVPTATGQQTKLPQPQLLEEAADRLLMSWPPGHFDSTIDLQSNPTKTPHVFTKGNHPFGWSGFAMAGPFRGLSALTNNVHGQNSDTTVQTDMAPGLFGIDREVYLGTLLQNAANPTYRWTPDKGRPTAFWATVDPTPQMPGVNEAVPSPVYPRLNLITPAGVFVSSPGYKLWEQVNAMAAWQDTLIPPPPPQQVSPSTLAMGQQVFARAGCISCHAGAAFTNNRILPVTAIATEPSRAQAFKRAARLLGPPLAWPFDAPVPLPPGTQPVLLPTEHLDPEQIRLAWAEGDSPGGYKVEGLAGLWWNAPYLHDGGVAVGPKGELGVPGTLQRGIRPDPAASLRALVDRDLRRQVIAANQASPALREVHVQGIGHSFWVDSAAGFTPEEQAALVRYLLSPPPGP